MNSSSVFRHWWQEVELHLLQSRAAAGFGSVLLGCALSFLIFFTETDFLLSWYCEDYLGKQSEALMNHQVFGFCVSFAMAAWTDWKGRTESFQNRSEHSLMSNIINRPIKKKLHFFPSCYGSHLLVLVKLWILFLVTCSLILPSVYLRKTSVK